MCVGVKRSIFPEHRDTFKGTSTVVQHRPGTFPSDLIRLPVQGMFCCPRMVNESWSDTEVIQSTTRYDLLINIDYYALQFHLF